MRVAGIPGENISTLLYPSSQVIMTGVQCFVSGGSRQSISWDNLRWSVIPIVFTRHTHGLIDINVQIINTWRLGRDRKALQYFYFPLKWVLIKPKLRCQSQAGQLSTIIVPVRNIMSGLERMLEVAINDQVMLDKYFYLRDTPTDWSYRNKEPFTQPHYSLGMEPSLVFLVLSFSSNFLETLQTTLCPNLCPELQR